MVQQIRIGLIGLSAAATGTGWATLAHLPYLAKSPYYKITALLNSSVENAEKAVKAYDLPADTKAYGTPEDLANDPNVDLVVVSTRVDKHAIAVLASVRAGKDVFVEWPLDRNLAVAKSLVEAAKQGGGKTLVGLQARQSPLVQAVKKIIADGKIGKPFSSSLIAPASNSGATESSVVDYIVDREVGGNISTIHFGHSIDYVFYVLGEPKKVNTIFANQRPSVTIVDNSTNPPTALRTEKKNTPDQILLQAELESGVVVSYHLRGGPPIPGSAVPPFIWRIYGEKGEIEVSGPSVMLNVGYSPGLAVRLHDHATGKVEEVAFPDSEFYAGIPGPARNIGRVYDGYAELKGVKPKESTHVEALVDFEEALKRHVLIDSAWKKWDEGQQGWNLPL